MDSSGPVRARDGVRVSAKSAASGAIGKAMSAGSSMFSSVSSFFVGVLVLAAMAVGTFVVVPYVGFMAWHHDDLQTGVDKATSMVIWEANVVGASYEGATEVTTEGFRDGQAMTQQSLGNSDSDN